MPESLPFVVELLSILSVRTYPLTFPRQGPRRECRPRGFNSVTMLRASNTVRAGETQKNQNRQYGDEQKRHHTGSFRHHFNQTRRREPGLVRRVLCYRSFGEFSLRTSKPVRQCAPISRAISFFRE